MKLTQKLLLLLALLPGLLCAQPYYQNPTFAYTGELAGIPSTCRVGSLSFITDATAGQNIYECASANTWTQQSGGAGGSVNISGTPTTGQYAVWTNANTVQGVTVPTLTGTPAASNISYWTGATTQALLSGTGLLLMNGASAPTVITPAAGKILSNTSFTSTPTLGASGTLGALAFGNATSGLLTLTPPAGAMGTLTTTLPNANSTLPIFGQQVTFAGPTAARTVTMPDANFTVARTDAANTFTGVQTMASPVITGSAVTFTTGTARTLANASEIIVCTSTCTVTPPGTLTAGQQFCVQNDNNVATVITLAAVTNIQYEVTARTSYKTANTSMTSAAAVNQQICMVAVSTTKFNVFGFVGTWN